MAETASQIQVQTSEVASQKEVEAGFGAMKGNSINSAASDAMDSGNSDQDELTEILKGYSAQNKVAANDDEIDPRKKLLKELERLGVNIAEISPSATIKDLEVFIILWTRFVNAERADQGTRDFSFDNINETKNPTYVYKEGKDEWVLSIWLQEYGSIDTVKVSPIFKKNNGSPIYRYKDHYHIKNGKIETEEIAPELQITDQADDAPIDDMPRVDESAEPQVTEPLVLSPDETSQPEYGPGGAVGTTSESGEIIEITEPDPVVVDDLQIIEEPTVDEKPTDILIEEVPTHEFNSSGLKFSRRDGKPLSYTEVQHYIEEQKKLGNQEFIDKFPKHIKGKDAGDPPTFEIEDSKYKYYALSYDPEWGKKEEPPVDNFYGMAVNSKAIVRLKAYDGSPFIGIRLHPTPIPFKSESEKQVGDAKIVYLPGTELTILSRGNDKNPGWVYVQTPDGKKGWIEEHWLIPVDEDYGEDYTLHYVAPGETVDDILRGIPNLERDIGQDNRAYAYVLWMMNKDNPGIYFDMEKYNDAVGLSFKNVVDPWYTVLRAMYQSIELKEGAVIRVPTQEGIDEAIASGQVPTRPEAMNLIIKGGRIIEGLLVGIPTGIALQAADMVTGIWDMIKKIFEGEFLDMLVELYEVLSNMTWEDFSNLILSMIGVDPAEFEDIWYGKNITVYERYKYFGEIIGRIIFEILMVIFVPGAVIGKILSKIPAIGKILSALQKVDKLLPDEAIDDLNKVERTVDKVDEAIVPVYKTEKAVETLLAPYKNLRNKLDEVKGKIGNTNYTKFEGLLRQLPDSVLKKLDENPDLLEAFAKRSLDDPDFFNAVQKGDLSKLDDLAKQILDDLSQSSVKDKLRRYLLNPDHPIGGSKAKWFKEALGYTIDNLDDLAKQIKFDPAKAVQTAVTEHGIKYNQVISIVGANGRIIDVTFAWIKNNDGVVRLVTGIPTK